MAKKSAKAAKPLGRDELLATAGQGVERTVVPLPLPGDHGQVLILKWGGPELDNWDRQTFDLLDQFPDDEYAHMKDVRARVFIASVCDEQGGLLFTKEDIGAVNRMDPQVLECVYRTAWKLNGLAVQAVGVLEGKSAVTPGSASGSG